jgi:N utilization substance protein B
MSDPDHDDPSSARSNPGATPGAEPATRHQQRERALLLLYEAELKNEDPVAVADGLPVPPDPYVLTLLRQTVATREEAERRIAAAAIGWPLERMAVIDRLTLRLAVAELLDPAGPPTAVVIDEAVELVKEYSTDESGSFVNGVLATVSRDIGPR